MTTENGMTETDVDVGHEQKYLEIPRGKKNGFRAFLGRPKYSERIVVLTPTKNHRVFHYQGFITAPRETVSVRVVRGNCKKM